MFFLDFVPSAGSISKILYFWTKVETFMSLTAKKISLKTDYQGIPLISPSTPRSIA